jgi:hypothetical protein
LKGMNEPIRAVRVVPEDSDPAIEIARFALPSPPRRGRRFPRSPLLATVTLVVLAAVAIPTYLFTRSEKSAPTLVPGVLIRIDPATNRIRSSIPIGRSATAVALGERSVWVADAANDTVTRIDANTGRLVSRIHVGEWIDAIAVGEQGAWVATHKALWRIDPITNDVTNSLPLPALPTGVAAGLGNIWVTVAQPEGLLKVAGGGSAIVGMSRATYPGFGPNLGVVVGLGALWTSGTGPFSGRVARGASAVVEKVDPETLEGSPAGAVQYRAVDFAVGERALWLVGANGALSKIDPIKATATQIFQVLKGASHLAVGGGYVWVTNPLTRRLHRLDARTGFEKGSVFVGKGVTDVAVDESGVWVTVSSAGPSVGP